MCLIYADDQWIGLRETKKYRKTMKNPYDLFMGKSDSPWALDPVDLQVHCRALGATCGAFRQLDCGCLTKRRAGQMEV